MTRRSAVSNARRVRRPAAHPPQETGAGPPGEGTLSRRRLLAEFAGAAAGAAILQGCRKARGDPAPVAAPPNVVFILADDLGWADLGCYGNTFIETPHIDGLAAQGMRFTDAYAAAPVCSPTRASIMTGQYPARTGIYDFIPGHKRPWARLVPPPNGFRLPDGSTTLAEALNGAGYVSASIGKWHLGRSPADHGFVRVPREGAGLLPDDFVRQLDGFARANPGKSVGPLTQQAVRFIEANRDRPFLCFLSHHAVHIPCQARQELIAKYEAKARRAKTEINPTYAAMTEALDDSVGLVLKALGLLGLAGRTVVIFFSDNGGLDRIYTGQGPHITTNAPLRDFKGTLYEGGIRDPLIVRWPGVARAGSLCRAAVISNDFLPTMLEMAGARPKPGQAIDGLSLLPLFKGAAALDRDTLYWYYPTYHHSTPAVAIREGDYKLLEFFEDSSLELYHLKDDIGETKNLARAMPEKAAAMRTKLHRWREALGAPLPALNPDYDAEKARRWG